MSTKIVVNRMDSYKGSIESNTLFRGVYKAEYADFTHQAVIPSRM